MEGGKKAITWIELLKEKLNFLKKTTGRSVSVGEVAGEAKKEWVQIKEGKHPKYSQGTSTKNKSSSKKHHQSTKKHSNKHQEHASSNEYALMKKVISECPKCQKKLNKLLNKTKKNKHRGGDNHNADDLDMKPEADSSAADATEADAAATPDATEATPDATPDATESVAAATQPQAGGKRKHKKKSKSRK
jgi:hypothetical protein